jgi:hypothetical protein
MNKIVPIQNSDNLCWKCLGHFNHIHKFVFGDLGYGSSFDCFGSQIQLCNQCYEESNPKIWDFEEIDTENEFGGHYKYEDEIYAYIHKLPIESRELFYNEFSFGHDGGNRRMEAQDWIDYELDILPHEKCKEYGMYSPEEIKAYREQFPICEHTVNTIYEDGSKGCRCPFGGFGEYGGAADKYNIWDDCYQCSYFTKRTTPIKDINAEDYENYRIYYISKIKANEYKNKFD